MLIVVINIKELDPALTVLEASAERKYEMPVDTYHPAVTYARSSLGEFQELLSIYLGLNGVDQQVELCSEAEFDPTLAQLLTYFDLMVESAVWRTHFHPSLARIHLMDKRSIALYYPGGHRGH